MTPDQGADWYAIVRVRINNVMAHNEPDAEKTVRQAIEDEGGIWQAIIGWADPIDTVLLSIEKVKDQYG
jgi:hypothetical protein